MNYFTKNMSKFKLITFDVTQTLLHFRRSPGEEYAEAAKKFGHYNVDIQKIEVAFPNVFRELANNHPNFGYETGIGWEKWWEKLISKSFQLAGEKISDSEIYNITNYLIDRYESADCWTKADVANELIEQMKNENKIVGIISNFDPRLKFLLANCNFPKFDFIIASYEAGAMKPSEQIFDLALKFGLERDRHLVPETALHIGNDAKLDYIGATKAGWKGILIGSTDAVAVGENEIINENHKAQSIADLLKKLQSNEIVW